MLGAYARDVHRDAVGRGDQPVSRGVRIGVLGGTFDPVHIGHLVAATWARAALGLDRVLLVVANEPWQKVGTRQISPAEDRFRVVEAAVAGVPGIEACRMEIDRGGPSYSADTIAELRKAAPSAQLHLIVGADVAAELGTWQRVGEIQDAVTLVVVDRGGVGTGQDPPGWRVERVRIPALAISSSELRRRLAEGRPVDFLIPEGAIGCIRRLNLYAGSR
jgi:nicotinate-nucleotide adenylyltransferase